MSELPLDSLRQDPSPEFAEHLRERLRRRPAPPAHARRSRVARAAAGLAVAAGIGFAFTVPGVRASAEAFLALFREVNFVAIPVNGDAAVTRPESLDLPHLIGSQVQVLEDVGTTTVVSIDAAGSAAGFDVRVPSFVPDGATMTRIMVSGRHVARLTADATRLRQLLDSVGLSDVDLPDGLDGATGMITLFPMVMTDYAQGGRTLSLMQGPIPEVLLPAGLDLTKMAEIGLRMLGLQPSDAQKFAGAIDWRTTLPVPVPPTASRFRQVLVGSAQGLEIEGPVIDPETQTERGNWNLVLWSKDGRFYAIRSTLRLSDVMSMANSLP